MLTNKAHCFPAKEGDQHIMQHTMHFGDALPIEHVRQDDVQTDDSILAKLDTQQACKELEKIIEDYLALPAEVVPQDIGLDTQREPLSDFNPVRAETFPLASETSLIQDQQSQKSVDVVIMEQRVQEEPKSLEVVSQPQECEISKTKEEVAASETDPFDNDKIRYRLVKKKPEKKRDALNTSYRSTGFNKFRGSSRNSVKICSRGSPKPGFLEDQALPSFNSQSKEHNLFNHLDIIFSEEKFYSKESTTPEKEGHGDKEEEEEAETREGSQKETENFLDKSQHLDDLIEESVKAANFSNIKAIISEKWSNSDSKDNETDYFEEKTSQASYSVINDIILPNTQDTRFNDEGFIEVINKKKGSNKKWKDAPEIYKGRKEYDSYDRQTYEKGKKFESGAKFFGGKSRDNNRSTLFIKSKLEARNAQIKESPVAKIPAQPSFKASVPAAPLIVETPASINAVQSKAPISNTGVAAPKKYKPLSLKSPSIDADTIKVTKVKEIAREFFNKKFEKDIYDHVSCLTDESNTMMKFRILAHSRIDYCLKKLFIGLNIQTNIFGSCATGLALPTSDIDICVRGLKVSGRNDIVQYIMTIHERLKQFKWIASSKPVVTANIPVLRLEIDPLMNFSETTESLEENPILACLVKEAPSELDSEPQEGTGVRIKIDLSLENMIPMGSTAHLGYKSTEFVQKMLNQYESLYTIAIILKEFLNNRGFLDNSQGGLSSYCLVVLIVAIFRKFTDEGSLKSLKRLLAFYGETFQPQNTGITIVGTDPFFPLNCYYNQAPLWILDNVNYMGKNIGQGAFAIGKVLEEFGKASKLVKSLQEKVEKIAVTNKDKINCLEDLEKLEDTGLVDLTSTNIVDSLVRFN